jgi:hypothetical protein
VTQEACPKYNHWYARNYWCSKCCVYVPRESDEVYLDGRGMPHHRACGASLRLGPRSSRSRRKRLMTRPQAGVPWRRR